MGAHPGHDGQHGCAAAEAAHGRQVRRAEAQRRDEEEDKVHARVRARVRARLARQVLRGPGRQGPCGWGSH